MNKTLPTFSLEKRLWKKGYQLVIGVDEVGKGAFAGPVTAAAVIFSPKSIKSLKTVGIDDSKRISSKQRENLARVIKNGCLKWAISSESAVTINRVGIVRATEKAMRKSIKKLNLLEGKEKIFILIDGRQVRYFPGINLKYQKNIFKGDRKCISIAAASILAKVFRDNIMIKLSESSNYCQYLWGKNKGYGTEEHRSALLITGPTRHHRKLFIKKYLLKNVE